MPILLSGYAHSQAPIGEHELQVQTGLIFNQGDKSFTYGGYPAGFYQSRQSFSPSIAYAYHAKVVGIEASAGYRKMAFNTHYVLPTDTVYPHYPLSLYAQGHYLKLQGTAFLRICQSDKCDVRVGLGMGMNQLISERFKLIATNHLQKDQNSGNVFRNMLPYTHVQLSYRKYFYQQFFVDVRGMMQYNLNGIEVNPLYPSPISRQQLSLQLGIGMKLIPKTSAI